MQNKKPLVQAKLDKHSLEHYIGSMVLFLSLYAFLSIWHVPEEVPFTFTLVGGFAWEVAQHTAYKSEESFDVLDMAFNLAGTITGVAITEVFLFL